jgi:HK97 family phage major capsid protein
MDDVIPGGFPVMFGDFSNYWIGDRGKRVIKRLVERYADRGQVAFLITERVDAKLVLPEAVKMLQISGTPAAESEE